MCGTNLINLLKSFNGTFILTEFNGACFVKLVSIEDCHHKHDHVYLVAVPKEGLVLRKVA